MTFWEHFFRVLCHKPLPALGALYWQVTRRKVRARNRLRVASADLAFMYSIWIEENERPDELATAVGASSDWPSRPRFSVIIHGNADGPKAHCDRSKASVQEQIYPEWELLEATAGIDAAIARAAGDFVVLLRAGDALSRTALFRFAEAVHANPSAEVLYGDQDHLDRKGWRTRPWFKPRWNEEMFLALDYVSSAVALESAKAKQTAQEHPADLATLLLVATSRTQAIVHVPHILVHVPCGSEPPPERLAAVAQHLGSRGAKCEAGSFGTVKVEWPLPTDLPMVTVIVPTRDKVELLRPCIESVLSKTDYPNFEILVIDNGSVDARTHEYFEEVTKDARVRILQYPAPYNFSAMNNCGVDHARGSYVCLLNNDTEVVEIAWLTEMMRFAVRADVGAVGAKLLYPDLSIQHAGVVIGIGGAAGHAHRSLPTGKPGYFRQPHVSQFVSAVTGACLVVEKRKFLAVDGLDEDELPVAFNDVDLCLKLQSAGWRNVYVPHAVLLHHESKTRESDISRKNIARFRREVSVLQDRWQTQTYQDPWHNPNLDRATENFIVRLLDEDGQSAA